MRKRRKMNKKTRNTLVGILLSLVLFCGLFIPKTVMLQSKAMAYQEKIDKYEKDIKQLKKDQKDLEKQKEYMNSDRYIEDMAREKLGLVYKDEVIFQSDQGQ